MRAIRLVILALPLVFSALGMVAAAIPRGSATSVRWPFSWAVRRC